ncbi:CpsD/CapB family tyrosine-protein kinase [Gammaproteobacteria bacterium]
MKKLTSAKQPASQTRVPFSLREDATRLFSLMNPVMSSDNGLVIQFIGANPGEGVSSLAREFAIITSQYVDGHVLLLDLDWGRGHHYEAFQQGLGGTLGQPGEAVDLGVDFKHILWQPAASTDSPMTIHPVGGNLHVSRQRFDLNAAHHVINQPRFWQDLRRKIRLTVVDSPPTNRHLDGIVICGMMDAVILVAAAETTRQPVITNLRDQILTQQAPLVGMVLNKRRFYIPPVIYRWLAI